jgi:hypothetical protein
MGAHTYNSPPDEGKVRAQFPQGWIPGPNRYRHTQTYGDPYISIAEPQDRSSIAFTLA